jgi:hypothetical protein
MREHRIHKTTFPLPAQLRQQKNPNPNTCSPIPLLPCPTSSRPRPMCSSRTLSLAGAIAAPPIRARHPFCSRAHRRHTSSRFVHSRLRRPTTSREGITGNCRERQLKNTHESLRGRPGSVEASNTTEISWQCANTHAHNASHPSFTQQQHPGRPTVERGSRTPSLRLQAPHQASISRRVASAF